MPARTFLRRGPPEAWVAQPLRIVRKPSEIHAAFLDPVAVTAVTVILENRLNVLLERLREAVRLRPYVRADQCQGQKHRDLRHRASIARSPADRAWPSTDASFRWSGRSLHLSDRPHKQGFGLTLNPT